MRYWLNVVIAAILVSVGTTGAQEASPTPGVHPVDDYVSVAAYEPVVMPNPTITPVANKQIAYEENIVEPVFATPSAYLTPGWNSSLEFLNWTLHRRGLDFAIPTDDTADAVGVGEVQNIAFDSDIGFRTGIGYLTQSGWEFGFRYTSYVASATADASALANLWATRTHPDRGEEALTADAFSNFDYDLFDFEWKRWLVPNETFEVAFVSGLRWANISQNFGANYDGDDFDQGTFLSSVDMTGFGLRMGFEGQWRVFGDFSGFARAAGTVMQGEFVNRITETNFSGADTVVDVTEEYSDAITQFEVATGFSWQRGPFDVAIGYELTQWSNLGDRTAFSSATHEGAYDPLSVDILLEGIFFRGSVVF